MVLVTAAALVVCMTGGGAGAEPGKLRVYEGPLGEAGVTIRFELVKREGRPLQMRSMSFGIGGEVPLTLTCDDGSVQETGFGFEGGLPRLPSHALDLDEVYDVALHVHGTIQAVHGSGTFSIAVPRFTQDEQVQSCSSGELTWTVERILPPAEGPASPTPIQVHFVMTSGARVTMTRVT